jgi:caa(3)-type oxidase subunit IV
MQEHVHHGPAYKDYVMVFVGLAVLTLGTVGISYTALGHDVKMFLAFAIATIKTLLVASIFMHLRFEPRTILIFAVTPVALAILFILAIAPDIGG